MRKSAEFQWTHSKVTSVFRTVGYRFKKQQGAGCRGKRGGQGQEGGMGGLLTCPIGVSLTEGSIGEAHGAVADNDKAWQADKLRVVH